MNTYYGYKDQMTQTWDTSGKRWMVTQVKTTPLTVAQVKSGKTDGYDAVQVAVGQRNTKPSKPMSGHLKASGLSNRPKALREIKLTQSAEIKSGEQVAVSAVLASGDYVQVSGVSKGKGFAGVVKRWGFAGGPRTHGQSDRERAPGSIGQGTTPGRVYKGKKMAGHYGNVTKTVTNLQVLAVDDATGTVWLSGPIPGAIGSLVKISKLRSGEPIDLITTKTKTDSETDSQESASEEVQAEATEPAAASTETEATTDEEIKTETEPKEEKEEKEVA